MLGRRFWYLERCREVPTFLSIHWRQWQTLHKDMWTNGPKMHGQATQKWLILPWHETSTLDQLPTTQHWAYWRARTLPPEATIEIYALEGNGKPHFGARDTISIIYSTMNGITVPRTRGIRKLPRSAEALQDTTVKCMQALRRILLRRLGSREVRFSKNRKNIRSGHSWRKSYQAYAITSFQRTRHPLDSRRTTKNSLLAELQIFLQGTGDSRILKTILSKETSFEEQKKLNRKLGRLQTMRCWRKKKIQVGCWASTPRVSKIQWRGCFWFPGSMECLGGQHSIHYLSYLTLVCISSYTRGGGGGMWC